jgi:hypothetical protein
MKAAISIKLQGQAFRSQSIHQLKDEFGIVHTTLQM